MGYYPAEWDLSFHSEPAHALTPDEPQSPPEPNRMRRFLIPLAIAGALTGLSGTDTQQDALREHRTGAESGSRIIVLDPNHTGTLYTVRAGDSLWSIANRYVETDAIPEAIERIAATNSIADPTRIAVGDLLDLSSLLNTKSAYAPVSAPVVPAPTLDTITQPTYERGPMIGGRVLNGSALRALEAHHEGLDSFARAYLDGMSAHEAAAQAGIHNAGRITSYAHWVDSQRAPHSPGGSP